MHPHAEGSLREQLEQQGYAKVRQFYDTSGLAALREVVAEIEHWPELPNRYMMYFEEPETPPRRRLLNRVENFVPYHEKLEDEICRGALARVVGDALGEVPTLFKDKINFKLPGAGGFEAHQDAQAGWSTYADMFVTAAVAIDPATPENGCLELAHWTHRHELIGDLWTPLTDAQLAGIQFDPLPMDPGDLVLFDAYLPHRSGPNHTPEPRRVLYITYNKSSAGDHRHRYYADKRASFPPDCERDPDQRYAYRV